MTCGVPGHSVRRSSVVDVRAASRPGKRRDQVGENERAERDEDHRQDGNGGVGHCIEVAGKLCPQHSACNDTDGQPHDDADHCGHRRLPSHRGSQLSRGKTERLQQRQVPSAPAYRCCKGEAEGDDRPSGKADREDHWCGTDAAVVHDLGGTLHTEHGDVVADRVGVGGEDSLSRYWRCVAGSPGQQRG